MAAGIPYSGSVAKISGGTGTVTYTITAGSLPLGITLSTADGIISGTPSHSGPYDFTVTATDSAAPPATKVQQYKGTIAVAGVPTITSVSPATGPTTGGTLVTITGTGFTGATSVKFEATNAPSYTVNSSTSITATAPAGAAGTVNVSVTTLGGKATITNGYTYY